MIIRFPIGTEEWSLQAQGFEGNSLKELRADKAKKDAKGRDYQLEQARADNARKARGEAERAAARGPFR